MGADRLGTSCGACHPSSSLGPSISRARWRADVFVKIIAGINFPYDFEAYCGRVSGVLHLTLASFTCFELVGVSLALPGFVRLAAM